MAKLDNFIFADLLATVVLSVLAFGAVEPWSIALFELNALLIMVFLSLRFVIAPQIDWKALRLALPLLALLLLGVCQIIPLGPAPITTAPESLSLAELDPGALSRDPQATRESVVKILALLLYFMAAIHTLSDAQRRRISLVALTIFGFAVSVFAIAQRLTYNGKMYWVRLVSPYIAPYGPYGNYNHFAGMIELIMPLPLAYLLFARINIEQRLIWFFSVVMMTVAAILSLSRGGFLTLGVQFMSFLLVIWFRQRHAVRHDVPYVIWGNQAIIGSALVAVMALTLWIGSGPLIERFGKFREGVREYSVVTRIESWRASWRIFLDHPLAGVGLGAFPAIYPSYGRSSAKYERLEQTHNDYLQLLTDAGLIGGGVGLWFLVNFIRIMRRQARGVAQAHGADRALIIGGCVAALGLLVHSFLDFNLQIAANALLLLFVVSLAAAPDVAGSRVATE
jgi:O-antigen ligase